MQWLKQRRLLALAKRGGGFTADSHLKSVGARPARSKSRAVRNSMKLHAVVLNCRPPGWRRETGLGQSIQSFDYLVK